MAAYTQSDLDNVRKAIAKGVTRVRIGDEELTYRDLEELKQIEAIIARDLGVSKSKRINYPQTSTGWR